MWGLFSFVVARVFVVSTSIRSDQFLRGASIQSTVAGDRTCRGDAIRVHDAAIVYLVPSPDPSGRLNPDRAQTDWNATLQSLRSLTNLDDGNRAEVRIFLDESDVFSDDNIHDLLDAASPRAVCTIRIKFREFPEGFDPESSRSPSAVRSKWGYEHMIRFFFADIFMTDALSDLKYWMRMDTDSRFEFKVDADPFAILDKYPTLAYLHNAENRDHGEVTDGLCDFVQAYAQTHDQGQPESCASSDHFVRGYFNNLEVGRVEDFQTSSAIEFMLAVKATQGIYRHRWGDALLRRILIELLGLKVQPLPKAVLDSYQHGHGCL